MKAGLSLGQTQSLQQSLVMTPALQQAIKLLQLSRLELESQIEQELLENPVLELQDDQDDSTDSQQAAAESEAPQSEQAAENSDFETYLSRHEGNLGEYGPIDRSDEEYETPIRSRQTSLDELAAQLGTLDLDPQERQIALQILGNIEDDGYLRTPLDELFASTEDRQIADEILTEHIQNLEPSGVGARDLREFLLIQLDNMRMRDLPVSSRIVRTIIERYLGHIDKRSIKRIARILQASEDDIIAAMDLIRHMDVSPLQGASDETPQTAIPDVYYLRDQHGEFFVQLADDLPRLQINPGYLHLARSGDREAYQFVERKYQAARWFLRSIEQRQRTILRVAQSILHFQRPFFEKGPAFLKGLNLRDVAEDIDVHESTVSRVTSNKYAYTPYGVFELKYFFSSGIKGGDLSVDVLKSRLRDLIESEPPEKPFSDDKLVGILKGEGFSLARRTIAKYRADMGIPTASQRKNRL